MVALYGNIFISLVIILLFYVTVNLKIEPK
jgi:hypothetical protein